MFDTKTRILTVDDMMTMRKIIGKTLRSFNYNDIIEAGDGNLGFEALQKSEVPVGLIISDWNMPNCTGLDFLKRVRADERFKHLPFVLITAESESHQIAAAVQAGVTGYIIKPFSPDTLKTKLEAAFKRFKSVKAA